MTPKILRLYPQLRLVSFYKITQCSVRRVRAAGLHYSQYKSKELHRTSCISSSDLSERCFITAKLLTEDAPEKRLVHLGNMTTATPLRELYPEIEPFNFGHLKVSDIHNIYYEECGNKQGKPVIYVHGGPGGGSSGRDRRYFDPAVYRIVVFDQRGAGRSLPPAELRENTTWDCVEDMEKLRKHLGVERWHIVFGGSWGSTLSLTYSETHPDRVKALVLRGIFTLRRKELIWYYQDGASRIFPDAYEKYIEPIPVAERHDLMSAYHRRLTGDDEATRLLCAQRWSGWEMATSRLYVDPELLARTDEDVWALQFARIECHFFVNGGWFESDDQILKNVDRIRHIPCTIVQGRYDVVCPADTAWELHKRFPEADFHMIADAGHSAKEPGTTAKLVEATDKYRELA